MIQRLRRALDLRSLVLPLAQPSEVGDAIDGLARQTGLPSTEISQQILDKNQIEVYRDPTQSFDICDIRGKICF